MPLKPKDLPSAQLLHSMFSLTPDGRLVNKISRTTRRAGDLADRHIDTGGYRRAYVDGRLQLAHRLVWVMKFGRAPLGYIDHINGNPLDNRPDNLREATHLENTLNRRVRSQSASGLKGIHRRKDNGMWRAYIGINGVRTSVGQFSTKAEAKLALDRVRTEMHGAFANHGAD